MTLRPHRYAWASLGGLGVLALALIGGVATTVQGSGAPAQQIVDVCLLFVEEAGSSVWASVTARPGSALVMGLVASSFGWAALRLAAALLASHRVARRFSRVTPGQVPELDRAMSRAPRISWGRLRILPSPAVEAFTVGIWRPRICLTTGVIDRLSEEELRAVLLHEAAHLKARDPFRLAAVSFLADALWFVPLARTLKETFARMAELQADQAALVQRETALELASAIVKTAQAKVGPAPAMAPALDGPSFLEERVERLLGVRRGVRIELAWRRALASGGVMAALLLLLLSGDASAPGPRAMTGTGPTMTMSMMPGCEPAMCQGMRGRPF